MKLNKLITAASLAGFVALSGSAFGQTATSNVVGYETLSLTGGQATLVGLRLHSNEAFSGTFDGSATDSLSDSGADFSSADSSKLYLVEIDDAGSAVNGTVIEVPGSDLAGTAISNLAGITADYEASYVIRAAATVEEIFGGGTTGSPVVLAKGGLLTADTVFIPATGETFFHTEDSTLPFPPFTPIPGEWQSTDGGNASPATSPLPYLDAMFVTVASAMDLVVAGDLKTGATVYPVAGANSFFSGVYPVGTTLDSSGLQNSAGFTKGGLLSADLVFDPTAGATFFHTEDSTLPFPPFTPIPGEWQSTGAGDGTSEVPVAFIYQLQTGSGGNFDYSPPTFYAGL